ncbi:MAG: PH domain-containing protein [Patescibacteria group bacterium]
MIGKLFSIFRESTNSFEGQKQGEEVLMLLRHHPFTIIIKVIFFVLAGLVPVIIWTLSTALFPKYNWFEILLFISSVWYLVLWLAVFHSLAMYTLNTVIITNQRIIDNDQEGFFNRKVSELHNHRIQDVSVHTNGFIETLLAFGDVTVQTAASEKQFVFHKVPEPERVKDTIMQITRARNSGIKNMI